MIEATPDIRLRDGTYVVAIDNGPGKRKRLVSLETRNIKVAHAMVRVHGLDRIAKLDDVRLARQAMGGQMPDLPMDHASALIEWQQHLQAFKAPKTASNYCDAMQAFFAQAGVVEVPLADVTPAQIDRFVNLPGKYGTRRLRLIILGEFYEYFRQRGSVRINPAVSAGVRHQEMDHADLETYVSATMTEPEFRSFLASVPQSVFWRGVATLGWYLGLRLSDAILLQHASLDEPDKIIIWTRKRLRRLVLPVDDPLISGGGELRAMLDEIKTLSIRSPKYCFSDQARVYERDQWIQSQEFRLRMRALGSRCTFRSFRKAASQRWLAEGKSLESIAEALGHSSVETTKIYLTR